MVADDGDAYGRCYLLEGVVESHFRSTPSRAPGETLDPVVGSGSGGS